MIRYALVVFVLTVFMAHGQDRPNILWITIEDTSPQFIGCYGNKNASTPIIDRIANEGVRFTNAFSTGTVCSPSRSTLITGVRTYKMGTGNHRSNYPIPDFIHGFPYFMKKAGYYVTNNYKTDYNVANENKFIEQTWNENSKNAGWWNRKAEQPFFAVFNFMESHQSRTMTMPYDWYTENVWDQLPPEDRIGEYDFPIPPIYRDSPEMRKHLARVYNAIKLTDNKIGALLKKLEDDGLKDDTIIFFFADHGEGIPRGKTNGIDMGYRVPFIIWFPEKYKHLSPWGKAGAVKEELISFEDLAPTLISLSGGKAPEYLQGRVLMGKKRSKPVKNLVLSSDRADNGIDMVRSITDGRFTYSRNFMPFMPQMRHIRYMNIGEITNQIRSDFVQNKLNDLQQSLLEERPAEFLFDLENDLWETNNLVDDPKYKNILTKMRNTLAAQVQESRDVHFLPEYEIGLISKHETPYGFRLDTKRYPIKEIYSAASLSGKRGIQIAKQQIALLENKNKIIRYWAILGLRSQHVETLKPFKKQILNAMGDSYPPVSILASTISYNAFGNSEAEKNLKTYCKNDNIDLSLLAINNLLYVDNKQPFVETIKTVYDMNKNKDTEIRVACMDFMGMLKLVPNTYETRN